MGTLILELFIFLLIKKEKQVITSEERSHSVVGKQSRLAWLSGFPSAPDTWPGDGSRPRRIGLRREQRARGLMLIKTNQRKPVKADGDKQEQPRREKQREKNKRASVERNKGRLEVLKTTREERCKHARWWKQTVFSLELAKAPD